MIHQADESGFSAFLDELRAAFEGQSVDDLESVLAFARGWYASTPVKELLVGGLPNRIQATLTAWTFVRDYHSHAPKVQVVPVDNPALAEQEYVIDVLLTDSPFIVDSLRMLMRRMGATVTNVIHAVLPVIRDHEGHWAGLGTGGRAEAYLHMELHCDASAGHRENIENAIHVLLSHIRSVVNDFNSMMTTVQRLADDIDAYSDAKDDPCHEAAAFLRWMLHLHFTFVGLRFYAPDHSAGVHGGGRVSAVCVQHREGDDLGLGRVDEHVDYLDQALACDIIDTENPYMSFYRSASVSTIHRPSPYDLVVIKRFKEDGSLLEEVRILGHYTSRALNCPVDRIPVLRQKAHALIERSTFPVSSHDGKKLLRILEELPREPLLQLSKDDVFSMVFGVFQIQERARLRCFIFRDRYRSFYSVFIFTPRDTFSTELRLRFQEIIAGFIDSEDLQFSSFFSESALVRVDLVMRVDPEREFHFDVRDIESQLNEAATSWSDRLREALQKGAPASKCRELYHRYSDAFSLAYRHDQSMNQAIDDIRELECLTQPGDIRVVRYALEEGEPEGHFGIRLYFYGQSIALSDALPIFESMRLYVICAQPYSILSEGRHLYLTDFKVKANTPTQPSATESSIESSMETLNASFAIVFEQAWRGVTEVDGFNHLVLAGFDALELVMLRTYARYLKQLRCPYSQNAIENAFARYPEITRKLVSWFHHRFDVIRFPKTTDDQQWINEIQALLDDVPSLVDDQIFRLYIELLSATKRTNLYCLHLNDPRASATVALKLAPQELNDIPEPKPKHEIFVYSSRVEGVHLRGGDVARGGLRWSDRLEDYRSEVLGLMKAQQVKNAVIVPQGAKGGFVCKRIASMSRGETQQEVTACYQEYITALLSITDNMVDGEVKRPVSLRALDGDDPYLVVAADKGTATFSDVANAISLDQGFWLGDAFASGGSVGYDHKKMGITARGAWVAVQRHFRELGVDTQSMPFTVVGIGDMGGDVFGNGMLLSDQIRLVAAFNHMHIFLDPDPVDSQAAHKERERLFHSPGTTWADYGVELISEGGGVFSRTEKSIPISAAVAKRFGIVARSLPPNELIRSILLAEYDLLWNGGIGTYVKSSTETHQEVLDKSNDALRVDASALRCKVIGEGGNLGVTPLARVEFGLSGGACNGDFVDNAAGVDCSDQEVNIKIALGQALRSSLVKAEERDSLLLSLTDDVAQHVLSHNYDQTKAISIAQRESITRMPEYRLYISVLEAQGRFERALEDFPDDEQLQQRQLDRLGFSRSEVAILVSYGKTYLKEVLSVETISGSDCFCHEAVSVFPGRLSARYPEVLAEHPLRKEIIATFLANQIVDTMGPTFVYRLNKATGADAVAIAQVFFAAMKIFDGAQRIQAIDALDLHIPAHEQMQLQRQVMRLLRRASRWLLRNHRAMSGEQALIDRYKDGVQRCMQWMLENSDAVMTTEMLTEYERMQQEGVPEDIALRTILAPEAFAALGFVDILQRPISDTVVRGGVAKDSPPAEVEIENIAALYHAIGRKLKLHKLYQAITHYPVDNHWQASALESLRNDAMWQQRSITEGLIHILGAQPGGADSVDAAIRFLDAHFADLMSRCVDIIHELVDAERTDLSVMMVAVRELMDLAQAIRSQR